jgi:hypothetical protein
VLVEGVRLREEVARLADAQMRLAHLETTRDKEWRGQATRNGGGQTTAVCAQHEKAELVTCFARLLT